MPTLQVRDLPAEIYHQLSYLAAQEHRSLAQQTIVLLKEGIARRLDNQGRRKALLDSFDRIAMDNERFPDPASLIRKDRDSR